MGVNYQLPWFSGLWTQTELCTSFPGSQDFPGGSDGKASVYNAGDPGLTLGQEDVLEKEMGIHSSNQFSSVQFSRSVVSDSL